MGDSGPLSRRGSELRTSQRFQVDDIAVPTVYEHGLLASLGIRRENQAVSAVNLSEGGILVRTIDRMKNGTKVKVHLEIEKFKDVIDAEGIVRWCFQSAKETSFYAGIQFLNVSRSVASKIAKLRGYYTSPEYKTKVLSKKRREALGLDFSG